MQIFSSGATSDQPTLSPEKESLLSASAGVLSKEIHWFGPGILSRFRTANALMTKAPTAAAAIESSDDQRVGCRICCPRYSSILIIAGPSYFGATKPSDLYVRIKYPEL